MICTIIGSGTWGSALAQVLADNNHKVTIYGVDKYEVEDISINHKNSKYFGDEVFLDSSITATTNLIEALKDTEVIVIAVPTFAVRSVLKQIKPYLVNKPYIVSVAKGFDGSYRYNINMPKGKGLCGFIKKHSRYPEEEEVLLNRKLSFKITRVRKENGVTILDIDCIGKF